MYFGRLRRRLGPDVGGTSGTRRLTDVSPDVWAETSGPRHPTRRLERDLYFGRLATGCIWDV